MISIQGVYGKVFVLDLVNDNEGTYIIRGNDSTEIEEGICTIEELRYILNGIQTKRISMSSSDVQVIIDLIAIKGDSGGSGGIDPSILNNKEDKSNKTDIIDSNNTSTVSYPSIKAVVDYVGSHSSSGNGVYFGDSAPSDTSVLWCDTGDINGGNGDVLPVGSMTMYAGSTVPHGWLLCDGSAISRTVYSELYSVLGIVYGSGDGSSTFNLPNLVNRFPYGNGGSVGLGQTFGNSSITLSVNQLPAHNHPYQIASDDGWLPQFGTPKAVNVGVGAGSNGQGTWSDRGGGGSQNYIDPSSSFIGNRGSGSAINILPPGLGINFIIKA